MKDKTLEKWTIIYSACLFIILMGICQTIFTEEIKSNILKFIFFFIMGIYCFYSIISTIKDVFFKSNNNLYVKFYFIISDITFEKRDQINKNIKDSIILENDIMYVLQLKVHKNDNIFERLEDYLLYKYNIEYGKINIKNVYINNEEFK